MLEVERERKKQNKEKKMIKKSFLLIIFLSLAFVYSGPLSIRKGETLEQTLYKDYGLKIENGEFLWYDPRIPTHPNDRVMSGENMKWKSYPHKMLINAIIWFGEYSNDGKKPYKITIEHKYFERSFWFWQRRKKFFYRVTKEKKLEFSKDKKNWEKVKVELVYEDFELKKSKYPPFDDNDPKAMQRVLFKLRINCKWFDGVFRVREPSA